MFTRSHAPILALFSTIALSLATGCYDANGAEGDDSKSEEVGEATSPLISVDFQKGCNSQGKVWDARNGKCLTWADACGKQGKYWDELSYKCLSYNSDEFRQALCAKNGMVYAGPGNMRFDYPGGSVYIQCVSRPSPAYTGQPSTYTGETLGYCAGAGCAKPGPSFYGLMHCTDDPLAADCVGR